MPFRIQICIFLRFQEKVQDDLRGGRFFDLQTIEAKNISSPKLAFWDPNMRFWKILKNQFAVFRGAVGSSINQLYKRFFSAKWTSMGSMCDLASYVVLSANSMKTPKTYLALCLNINFNKIKINMIYFKFEIFFPKSSKF